MDLSSPVYASHRSGRRPSCTRWSTRSPRTRTATGPSHSSPARHAQRYVDSAGVDKTCLRGALAVSDCGWCEEPDAGGRADGRLHAVDHRDPFRGALCPGVGVAAGRGTGVWCRGVVPGCLLGGAGCGCGHGPGLRSARHRKTRRAAVLLIVTRSETRKPPLLEGAVRGRGPENLTVSDEAHPNSNRGSRPKQPPWWLISQPPKR